jgi:hypothetical protein
MVISSYVHWTTREKQINSKVAVSEEWRGCGGKQMDEMPMNISYAGSLSGVISPNHTPPAVLVMAAPTAQQSDQRWEELGTRQLHNARPQSVTLQATHVLEN